MFLHIPAELSCSFFSETAFLFPISPSLPYSLISDLQKKLYYFIVTRKFISGGLPLYGKAGADIPKLPITVTFFKNDDIMESIAQKVTGRKKLTDCVLIGFLSIFLCSGGNNGNSQSDHIPESS